MSKLVIVESPAKAHTIEKFLGKGYSVCASNGHVRDLPKSRLGVDIENDFEPKYITIRGKSDVVEKLKQSAKSAEKIYFATDPDREGEAISWHLASLLKIPPEDACRVEFNEITKDAVTNALKSPRKLNMYLVNAQQARRVLDRLVGYKISPILWVKVKKGLSAGRVQSVATRLVVDREREIENFIPKEYWLISASLKDSNRAFEAKFFGKAGKKLELGTEAETLEIVNALKNAEYKVVKAVYGSKKRHAPPPFTTSMMQQEASWRLGFTTKKTAMIAQKLYEGVDVKGEGMVGLITYMRTDSVRVSAEAQKSAQEFIRNNFGAEIVPEKPNVYKSSKSSQDAHEAIRPTSVFRTPESIKGSLSPDHYKLYKLIYDRFLASQMSEAVYKTLNAEIEAYEYLFKYSGSTLEFKGYLRAYKEDDTEDQTEKLPELAEGKTVKLVKLNHEQKFTEPPSRFTEGTLVRELEDKGIGRPSTYAPTISTIIDRGYVVREGKLLKPTELGFLVTDLMCEHFADIVNISFTADMENQLDEIEEGRAQWKSVVAEFYQRAFGSDLPESTARVRVA